MLDNDVQEPSFDKEEARRDVVTQFFNYTASHKSPEVYRRWAGIALLAGACERRFWVRTGSTATYLNLYTFLVGPPGTGKFIIDTTREIWAETTSGPKQHSCFHVAPNSMSKAGLIDTLLMAEKNFTFSDGSVKNYYSLLVAAEELATLIPKYDVEFVGALNDIWNNPTEYAEARRKFSEKIRRIKYPQLNILAGVQPSLMAELFPDTMWNTGLASRIIMVYSDEFRIRDPFDVVPGKERIFKRITEFLAKIAHADGEITWSEEAGNLFQSWVMNGMKPAPQHSKLQAYSRRRDMLVIKLAGLSVISRNHGEVLQIQLLDLERAFGWIFDVERKMPDIFRSMIGRSDYSIVEELHRFMVADWNRNGHVAIKRDRIFTFLGGRTTSNKIHQIFIMAEQMGVIIRQNDGQFYMPKAGRLEMPE